MSMFQQLVPAPSTARRWRRVTTALAGSAVLLATASGCSSFPGSTKTTSTAAVSSAASSAGVPADAITSGSAAPTAGKAKQAPAPCTLVTAGLLTDTLGTETTRGIFEPTTAAGTGCRFTKVDASSSINILAEVTSDAANYLPELPYTPPAGSNPIPGADRGFVKPPAAGASTSSILLVKGSIGVFVTIFQDSPPVTAAGLQKLASTVLAGL